jgi:hypothetical protein
VAIAIMKSSSVQPRTQCVELRSARLDLTGEVRDHSSSQSGSLPEEPVDVFTPAG